MSDSDREHGRRGPRGGSRSNSTLGGALLASIGIPLLVLHMVYGPGIVALPVVVKTAAVFSVVSFLLAGMGIDRFPRMGRIAGSLALLALLGLGTPYLREAPFVALVALLGCTAMFSVLWDIGLARTRKRTRWHIVYGGHTRGAALVAAPLWLALVFSGSYHPLVSILVVGIALGIANALVLVWMMRMRVYHPKRVRALALAALVAMVQILFFWGQWWHMASAGIWLALGAILMIPNPNRIDWDQASWWELLLDHPERLFVGTFGAICLAGTLLLLLPQSTVHGGSITFIDALFTSVSAVCVTGLTVLDTPNVFNGLGQFFLVILIQIGGLGIMTFSTLALWAMGGRMSLRHEGAVASLISSQDRGKLFVSARQIIAFTFVIEAVGALLLWVAFLLRGDGAMKGLWRAVFTAVSAFCNAGFALQSDNLLGYQDSPFILHTVAMLVILGGLSPMAVFSLPLWIGRSKRPVSLQSKLSLVATAGLLVVGTVGIALFEWNGALRDFSLGDAIHNAWFQSVTLRTAGFNSIDMTGLSAATLTLMMLWMFIGGSPGGTSGGIKTTTASVLCLSVVHTIMGRWPMTAFGRRISERTWRKAAVTVTLALLTVMGAVMALFLTQSISPRALVFEVISALGTVGLSIGATAQLDGIGKIIITLCMFVGRVGGLTLLMFLSQRRPPRNINWPEEDVNVG